MENAGRSPWQRLFYELFRLLAPSNVTISNRPEIAGKVPSVSSNSALCIRCRAWDAPRFYLQNTLMKTFFTNFLYLEYRLTLCIYATSWTSSMPTVALSIEVTDTGRASIFEKQTSKDNICDNPVSSKDPFRHALPSFIPLPICPADKPGFGWLGRAACPRRSQRHVC